MLMSSKSNGIKSGIKLKSISVRFVCTMLVTASHIYIYVIWLQIHGMEPNIHDMEPNIHDLEPNIHDLEPTIHDLEPNI